METSTHDTAARGSRPWFRHYDPGVPRAIDYEPLLVPDFLRRTVERLPHRPALVFQGRSFDYRWLGLAVARAARGFARLGVGKGTSVAIQLPNLPQTVVAYQAVLALGGRVVLTNPLYTAREVEHQWNDAEAEVCVLADFLYAKTVRALRPRLGVRHFVVARIADHLGALKRLIAPHVLARKDPPLAAPIPNEEGVTPWLDFLGGGEPALPRVEISPDDVAVLQYTGGTTGVAKGAMLTHKNLSVNVQQIEPWLRSGDGAGRDGSEEVFLTCLPLFHVFGMTVGMNWPIRMGSKIVLAPNPRDLPALVDAIEKERVTIFPAVPALFDGIARQRGIEKRDLRSVRACVSGSAPLPSDVRERFEKLTGAKIVEGFGLTETSPVTHCNPLRGRNVAGSIGVPIPDTDCLVVALDDDGRGVRSRPVGVGEPGELLIRGPQVMAGYWKRPDETRASLDGGWLHTGDLATIDDDGYFRIVGRTKEMINVGGLKVYPDEVDDVLTRHPDVVEAATIGIPDPSGRDVVKSFVVVRPGARLDAAAVRAHCQESLAPHKIPREVEFIDALPRSSVLKVLRRELLRKELEARGRAR
jgi:long-chain acyl-CoA synthetase